MSSHGSQRARRSEFARAFVVCRRRRRARSQLPCAWKALSRNTRLVAPRHRSCGGPSLSQPPGPHVRFLRLRCSCSRGAAAVKAAQKLSSAAASPALAASLSHSRQGSLPQRGAGGLGRVERRSAQGGKAPGPQIESHERTHKAPCLFRTGDVEKAEPLASNFWQAAPSQVLLRSGGATASPRLRNCATRALSRPRCLRWLRLTRSCNWATLRKDFAARLWPAAAPAAGPQQGCSRVERQHRHGQRLEAPHARRRPPSRLLMPRSAPLTGPTRGRRGSLPTALPAAPPCRGPKP